MTTNRHQPSQLQAEQTAPRRLRRQQGMTLVEVTFGLASLTTVMIGLAAALGSTQHLLTDQESRTIALQAAHMKLNELQANDFLTLLDDYGPTSGNDTFDVEGLVPPEWDTAVGHIEFFVDETTAGGEAGLLGLPRDLDGDGLATSTDVSATYQLLPVQIRVRWDSAHGPSEVVVRQLVFDEQ